MAAFLLQIQDKDFGVKLFSIFDSAFILRSFTNFFFGVST